MERRSSILILACSLFLLLISGCGRNSPTKQERTDTVSGSAPTANPQSEDTRPVIVAFGDSLTAGVAGRSYPDILQDLMDQNGFRYRIDNQGVSGDTTTDGLARIDNVMTVHPSLVILEFGGNDGLRGIPVESTRKNLEEMIERLRKANLPIVLLGITLPPNYGPEYVKSFTTMYPELAKKYRLRFLPFLLIHTYRDFTLMQPDGIHPNGEGNKIVAKDVFELVRPLLRESPK